MSKFVRDVNINDAGNRKENNTYQANSGGYNIVDNSTTNNQTINNRNIYTNQGSNKENAAVALIPIFFGVVFLIWSFFNNFDLVAKVLNAGTYTSPALAVISVIILFVKNQFEISDLRNLILSLALGLIVLLLNENAYFTAPLDVIDLSMQYTSIIDFWSGLTDDQQHRAFVTFSSYALIFISCLLNHFVSFRQLSYSLANEHKRGFWYLLYLKTDIFKFRCSGVAIMFLSILSYLILKGYLFQI